MSAQGVPTHPEPSAEPPQPRAGRPDDRHRAEPELPADHRELLSKVLAVCGELQAELRRLRGDRRDGLDPSAAPEQAWAAAPPEVVRLRREIAAREMDIEALRDSLAQMQARAAHVERHAEHLEAFIGLIQGTIGWKILERLRRIRDRVVPGDSRRGRVYRGLRRGLGGRRGAALPYAGSGAAGDAADTAYERWIAGHEPTGQDVALMKAQARRLLLRPTISLVTPVYNTDPAVLRRMADSVMAQVYPHWQLCLADDGSTDPATASLLDELGKADPRIVVERLDRNGGIAAASNRAAAAATGEFLALLDHDDELAPHALFELARRLNEDPDLDILYSDEDKLDGDGRRVDPFFKPAWSPDLLLSMNYVGHLLALRRTLFDLVGGFRAGFEGSQDYDLLLRATEQTSRIAHIPKVLYHWRKGPGSVAADPDAKPHAGDAAERALTEALARRGVEGHVETVSRGRYAARYRLQGAPKVSIIIPTRDRLPLLRQCIDSIETRTDHAPLELIVVDNNSTEPGAVAYLDSLRERHLVCTRTEPFNFARLNNFAVTRATGDYLLFLNNDTQVIDAGWVTAMLEQAQRPEVGAVGAKLLYPDLTIQHAGVVLGIGGVAGHAFKHMPDDSHGYFDIAHVIRNCSAVTGACMMVPRAVFEKVAGFDERLAVVFNDIDLCLRIRQHGYLVVYTPRAVLYHVESASRRQLHPPAEEQLMWRLWGDAIRAGDPYYNPNLTRTHEDWSVGA